MASLTHKKNLLSSSTDLTIVFRHTGWKLAQTKVMTNFHVKDLQTHLRKKHNSSLSLTLPDLSERLNTELNQNFVTAEAESPTSVTPEIKNEITSLGSTPHVKSEAEDEDEPTPGNASEDSHLTKPLQVRFHQRLLYSLYCNI